jgi:hypothetical protein
MRVSVQVRRADGQRWGRSVYVDPSGSMLRVLVSTLGPIAPSTGPPPAPRDLTSLLIAVDLENAVPGHEGVLQVRSSALVNDIAR